MEVSGRVERGEAQVNDSEQRRLEFKFPLLILRTKRFDGFFKRLGAFRFSRLLSWAALVIVPVVAVVGLYLIFNSLFVLLWNPAAGDVVREAGPGVFLLLPGINPFLPFLHGWIAIFCAIALHEGAHGVAARSLGLNVKSSGLLFFLFVPIGAFVDVDEDQLKKASGRVSSRVLAAGVGSNIVAASACLVCVLVIVSSLAPVVDGVYVVEVLDGMPAEAAGLLPKDVILSVDDLRVNRTADLSVILKNKTRGDVVLVTVARGDSWQSRFSAEVNLTTSENRTVIGVQVADLFIEERQRFYQNVTPESLSLYLIPPTLASGLVPFSDALAPFYTHWLGPQWHVVANMFFWLWFINVNVAVFNALPIYPMDGGRMFNIALKRLIHGKEYEKLVSAITAAVTIALVLVLLLTILVPFLT